VDERKQSSVRQMMKKNVPAARKAEDKVLVNA